jgi:hypothetical protein
VPEVEENEKAVRPPAHRKDDDEDQVAQQRLAIWSCGLMILVPVAALVVMYVALGLLLG